MALHFKGAALIHRAKLVLTGAANGADPVRRQFIERGVSGDMIVRVSLGRIIDIATYLALILLHDILLFQPLKSVKIRTAMQKKIYLIYKLSIQLPDKSMRFFCRGEPFTPSAQEIQKGNGLQDKSSLIVAN
jgi:hypothetical protein